MVARAHFPSQHRRKQHAIIGKPRLLTDHHDGITAERTLGEFFAQAGSCHAVANDDERFAHCRHSFWDATASIRLTKHSRSFAWIAKIRSCSAAAVEL